MHSEFDYFAMNLPLPLELCPLIPLGLSQSPPPPVPLAFQDSDFYPVPPMYYVLDAS